jgi:LysM repeat protein
MRSVRVVVRPAVFLSVASLGLLGACGGDSASPATTLKPLTSTNFATVPPVAETTTTVAGNSLPEQQLYTVQAGDFLSKIAQQFGVTMEEIVQYNEWTDGINHPLFPGDEIAIPGGATQQVDPTGGTTTIPITGGEATTTTVAAAVEGASYTVEAGDFLAGIADKFDTTVDAIVAANGWASSDQLIYPGLVIKLPA